LKKRIFPSSDLQKSKLQESETILCAASRARAAPNLKSADDKAQPVRSHSMLSTAFTAMAKVPLLPSEILSSIANHAWDSFKTLSALSLVNHTLNHHARNILFERLLLSPSGIHPLTSQPDRELRADFASFSSILLSNPNLGQHVRELTLSRLNFEIFKSDTLLPILLNVPNLRLLRVEIYDDYGSDDQEFSKDHMRSHKVYPALLFLIKSPKLTTLHLSSHWFDWRFIAEFLAPATQIGHLTLYHIRFPRRDIGPDTEIDTEIHLNPTPTFAQVELLPSSSPIRLSSLSIDLEAISQFLEMADHKCLHGESLIDVSKIRRLMCRRQGIRPGPWVTPEEVELRKESLNVNFRAILSRVPFLESFALEGASTNNLSN